MSHLLAIGILFIMCSLTTKAQLNYSGKVEAGYLKFQHYTVQVEPGSGWKGRALHDDGIDINSINGLTFANKKLFAGLGLGYMNFKGVSGASIFADLEYLPLKTRITPLLNLKVGYDHLWSQYEGGTGTSMAEFGLGVNYKLTENLNIFFKTGMLYTQQSLLLPLRIGIRF